MTCLAVWETEAAVAKASGATTPVFRSAAGLFSHHGIAMRLKIGVMGAATGDFAPAERATAYALGEAIARNGCITVTGACPGLPFEAARGAKAAGGLVLGISPGLSLDEHIHKYRSPAECHDILVFTGSGLMGREVVNIRSSDMIAIVGGRSGTLGELAIAYDEGKLIGVLLGTGGITDIVGDILRVCDKDTGARVVYGRDPQRLADEMLRLYRAEHFRRPSCFCEACACASASDSATLTEK